MKKIEIIGANYFGHWNHVRKASRGIVLRGDEILLSHEARSGQYMIPGGGLEAGETEAECCAREVAEETGLLVETGPCVLEIDEYYEDWKYVSCYFLCKRVGETQRRPTEREREVGMAPRWVPVPFAIEEFSRHGVFADTDEMRRGLYQREHAALRALLGGSGLEAVSLRQRPELLDAAAAWFHEKWGVSKTAYLERMAPYLSGESAYGWYLCLDGARIVGGLGVIDNDFHDRVDLSPNICAVYTEPEYRGRGVAGRLLDRAVSDLRAAGVSPVYLVTDHVGFYERYGWEFLCTAHEDGGGRETRVYVHR